MKYVIPLIAIALAAITIPVWSDFTIDTNQQSCSQCPFPCSKAGCEALRENNYPCTFVEDLSGQYCLANYNCWLKSNNNCIQKNDAATCLSECTDDTMNNCFGRNIFNTYSACQAALSTNTVTAVPSCWTCNATKFTLWHTADDPYCDNYGYYNCGETDNRSSSCYQAACRRHPPSCWSGSIGQYDSSYGDGICETQWGATNNTNSACYDVDCDLSSCNDYYGDEICDDTLQNCGSFYKNWTSMAPCHECLNGGFNCTTANTVRFASLQIAGCLGSDFITANVILPLDNIEACRVAETALSNYVCTNAVKNSETGTWAVSMSCTQETEYACGGEVMIYENNLTYCSRVFA